MRHKHIWFAFALLSVANLSRNAEAAMTRDIAKALTAAMVRNHLLGHLPTKCISYALHNETPAFLDVDVHEIHGSGCPGDPETYPRITSLRFDKRTRRVLQQNADTDQFVPLR